MKDTNELVIKHCERIQREINVEAESLIEAKTKIQPCVGYKQNISSVTVSVWE